MYVKVFLMAMSASVKVICVCGRKSPPLMQGMEGFLPHKFLLTFTGGNRETITVFDPISGDGRVPSR